MKLKKKKKKKKNENDNPRIVRTHHDVRHDIPDEEGLSPLAVITIKKLAPGLFC